MKKLIKNTLLLFALSLFIFACQEDLDIEDAGSVTLAGDWVVIEYSLDGDPLYGPYTLQIYNTSFNTDEIWVDNIYDSGFKVRSQKLSETTFGVTGAVDVNENFSGTIDILDAKVIDQDSIVFRVVLYNADGEVIDDYLEAGHRYTGWPEDQH